MRKQKSLRSLAVLGSAVFFVVLTTWAISCSKKKSTNPGGGAIVFQHNLNVTIRDNSFSPQYDSISVGQTITWTNAGSVIHNVTSAGGFTSSPPDLSPGASYPSTGGLVFNTPGDYPYQCTHHAGMTGTIRVK